MSAAIPKHSGAAIISALLIVALAAALSVQLLRTLDIWQSSSQARNDAAQARWLGLAGVDYARAILAEDTRRGTLDHLGEPWANPLPLTEVEGGRMGGMIEDQQGKWNLNNLAPNGTIDKIALAAYQKLLQKLDLPNDLANSLADWLDADEQTQANGGAESDYYLTQTPPFRAANRPLADISELSRVRGYDSATIERLSPYVTVLPGTQPININTASPLLLTVVQPELTLQEAEALVIQRKSRFFIDGTDFKKRLPRELPATIFPIGTASQYFLAKIHVEYGLIKIEYQALLRRLGGGAWPKILFVRTQ